MLNQVLRTNGPTKLRDKSMHILYLQAVVLLTDNKYQKLANVLSFSYFKIFFYKLLRKSWFTQSLVYDTLQK